MRRRPLVCGAQFFRSNRVERAFVMLLHESMPADERPLYYWHVEPSTVATNAVGLCPPLSYARTMRASPPHMRTSSHPVSNFRIPHAFSPTVIATTHGLTDTAAPPTVVIRTLTVWVRNVISPVFIVRWFWERRTRPMFIVHDGHFAISCSGTIPVPAI